MINIQRKDERIIVLKFLERSETRDRRTDERDEIYKIIDDDGRFSQRCV